jgi:D-glycero-alpha-D-manno-heptose-7-phosphate kinase
MIVVQTPLRISFLGGGTDFPGFYERDPGCVISTTIDKSVFVILKSRFDDRIRVGYTRTELVDHPREVEHDLVREALAVAGVDRGIEIATMADIPSRGSGLGSSSAMTVGLLHALWQHRGVLPSRRQLADGATEVEVTRLGRPMGMQDQFASAYGGLRMIDFDGEGIRTERLVVDGATRRRLGERLMLFFTGITRRSGTVLAEQEAGIEAKRDLLVEMAALAREGRTALESGEIDRLGELMDVGWRIKRQLASRVSSPEIDGLYEAARKAGAIGGKISGAGGGGFLMLYCLPERQAAVRAALSQLQELEFHLEDEGSLVMLDDRRR